MVKSEKHIPPLEQEVLGEGSYGCVITPGFDNNLKNNSKKYVTKISKIDFYSKNEYLISKQIKSIPKYSTHFLPIIKQSVINFDKLKNSNFDVNRCENLQEYNMGFHFLKADFLLLTLKLIDGNNPRDYFDNIYKFKNKFVKNYLYTFSHINKALILLNNKNIVHNDLYDRNILVTKKSQLPIVIDFGLSYDSNKILNNNNNNNNNNNINLKLLESFYFSYKAKHYNHLHEKNFINFIINNKSDSDDNSEFDETNNNTYYSVITDLKKPNDLTIEIIKICINNFKDTFLKVFKSNKIYNIFENNDSEFDFFLNSFEIYYRKFLDTKKYPTYNHILNELLPNSFIYTDLYSTVLLYLEIYNNHIVYYKNNYKNNYKHNPVIKILHSLFKKIILPDPYYRINPSQLKSIINQIFTFIKNIDLNDFKNELNTFITNFNNNLKKINIPLDIFYYKKYAYIDFTTIFTPKNLLYLKKINLNFNKLIIN